MGQKNIDITFFEFSAVDQRSYTTLWCEASSITIVMKWQVMNMLDKVLEYKKEIVL